MTGLLSVVFRNGSLPLRLRVAGAWRSQKRSMCSKASEETGRIAAKEPFEVSLQPGKTYFWCKCGQSKKQPWCDGSHKGSGFTPVKFTVKEAKSSAFLCGCKQTSARPYCDGTHGTPLVQNYTSS